MRHYRLPAMFIAAAMILMTQSSGKDDLKRPVMQSSNMVMTWSQAILGIHYANK